MHTYARLAILLGIAMALLAFATQHATQRGGELATLLEEKSAQSASTSQQTLSAPSSEAAAQGHSAPASLTLETTSDLLAKLASEPAGESSIALSQQLEASIKPETTEAYVKALLTTDHPAVERATHAALSRTADSTVIQQLAHAYGNIPEQHRGRILQVLENVQNPASFSGLEQTVAADTSEKGSPILLSAMYGAANLGNAESVSYLLSQVPTRNEFYALQALGRVTSDAGREVIRAAVAGNKDGDALGADGRRMVAAAAGL